MSVKWSAFNNNNNNNNNVYFTSIYMLAIPLDSVQCGKSDSAKIIEEIAKKKKKLVNIN